MSTSETPKLTIICSSEDGRQRLERVAEAMLAMMAPETAAMLARCTLTFALDRSKHGAFTQGLGGPHDGVGLLAEERVRQQKEDPTEPINIIVLAMDAQGHLPTAAFSLAHELGHIVHGDTRRTTATPEEKAAMEAAADDFARRYAVFS